VTPETCPEGTRAEQEAWWADRLWELNQPVGDRPRSTVFLREEWHVERLREVLALTQLVALNGGPERLRSQPLQEGSMLLLPDIQPAQKHVIDAEVARYFFLVEHYYGAAIDEIGRKTKELKRAVDELLKPGRSRVSTDGRIRLQKLLGHLPRPPTR
jgi:hypothetical protein